MCFSESWMRAPTTDSGSFGTVIYKGKPLHRKAILDVMVANTIN